MTQLFQGAHHGLSYNTMMHIGTLVGALGTNGLAISAACLVKSSGLGCSSIARPDSSRAGYQTSKQTTCCFKEVRCGLPHAQLYPNGSNSFF